MSFPNILTLQLKLGFFNLLKAVTFSEQTFYRKKKKKNRFKSYLLKQISVHKNSKIFHTKRYFFFMNEYQMREICL